MSSNIRTGRHYIFSLHVHLVFATKYRKDVFSPEHLSALKEIFRKICGDFGSELKEFDGETDYVHLLISYPPKVSVSRLANSLKGASSRKLKNLFPELERRYWKGKLWSSGYFANSCGDNSVSLKQYIGR